MSNQTPEQIAEARIQKALESGVANLDMSFLELNTLPESLGQLTQLQTLNVSNNRLDSLPESLGQLTQLQSLDAYSNRFSALPESLSQLTQLKSLDVSRSYLTALPESLGQLTQLQNLDVAGSYLTALPESLSQLTQLKSLFLHDNPALNLPPEVLGPDWSEVTLSEAEPARPADILEYYFRSRQSRPLNEAKLILVGRGGAGKTSLVNRLLRRGFDKDERKTPGISITPWELALGDEKVQLNIWDFGGQEIMHATHQFFLTERSLYLLVVNAREGEQDANIEYWLRLIESFGAESPVLVVINKVKDHPFDLNRRGLQEKFPAIRGFIQTDCEDATGIEELRRAIERETDRLEHLRDPFPASWFSIKRHLSNMEKNFISYEEYQAECRTLGVEETQSQETLVGFLHCLGIVLNFKDDPRLADTHVLNPEWVTGGVYKILNAEQLAKSGGVLRMADLRTILPTTDYPRRTHTFVMDLMRKFELCFHFEDGHERFLIPELLGKEEPPLNEFQGRDTLRFEYHYNILPEGLLPRFIVRTHEMSSGQARWRTGVVLEYEGNYASIKADVQDRKVFITIIGPPAGRRRLLSIIRSHFDHIHRSVARLEATEMVPVPGYKNQILEYRKLLVREANGKNFVEIEITDKVVEIPLKQLLDGIESKAERAHRLETGTPRIINVYGKAYIGEGEMEHIEGNKYEQNISNSTFNNSAVAIQQVLQSSYNTIGQMPESNLKNKLQELTDQTAKAMEELDEPETNLAKRRLDSFVEEASSPKPDKSLLEVTGKGLIEAAKTVATMAPSITETVKAILELIPS